MCLIILALGQHQDFPAVLVANRDEYYQRPTLPMHWWADLPLLAGRDLQSGGTWLGLSADGRCAAVTNYRELASSAGKASRGHLPVNALQMPQAALTQALSAQGQDYSGYSLLAFDGADWRYRSNRDRVACRRLHRGFYGLSNHLLQSNWPKVQLGRQRVMQALARDAAGGNASRPLEEHTRQLHEALLRALQHPLPAPREQLPDTGVGIELESFLSPLLITGTTYGTRATTAISWHRSGQILVTEQTWRAPAMAGQVIAGELRQYQLQAQQP